MEPGRLLNSVMVLVLIPVQKRQHRDEQTKSILQKALQKTFAPEFLNRIDDVIMFNSLGKEEINKIIDLELKGLYDRVKSLGYQLKIATAARDFIAEKGFDANFGARPLKRAIQKYLEDPMAEVLIKANLQGRRYVLMLDLTVPNRK